MPGWQDGCSGTEGGLPDIEDLTGPAGDPDAAVAEVRHSLGIGTPRVRYGQDQPDTRDLRKELGLA
jgi:hypothetical protein